MDIMKSQSHDKKKNKKEKKKHGDKKRARTKDARDVKSISVQEDHDAMHGNKNNKKRKKGSLHFNEVNGETAKSSAVSDKCFKEDDESHCQNLKGRRDTDISVQDLEKKNKNCNDDVERMERREKKKSKKKNKKHKTEKKKKEEKCQREQDSGGGNNDYDECKKKNKKRRRNKDSIKEASGDHAGIKSAEKEKLAGSALSEMNNNNVSTSISRENPFKVDNNHDNQDEDITEKIIGGRVITSSAVEFLPPEIMTRSIQTKPIQKTKTVASANVASTAENDKNKAKAEVKPAVVAAAPPDHDVTLLLFYQYVEPPWNNAQFQTALDFVQSTGEKHGLTGRMRVAKEGLNCTLTGTHEGVRAWCAELRTFSSGGRPNQHNEFRDAEFKLTDHLPRGQLFPKLHVFPVEELVHYGLSGRRKAPSITKTGTHLEPEEYHVKLAEPDTVVIDVRNHYEANIGRFVPPPSGARYIDPKMRKSTEFPVWLDKPETKERLRGKQVLMYCTGGVRCERASALLRHKMETEDDVKNLGIRGVYQLQGGVDKYFKKFPLGGFWNGKNYVFDKRFAHAPPKVECDERAAKLLGAKKDAGVIDEVARGDNGPIKEKTNIDEKTKSADEKEKNNDEKSKAVVMGKCEACRKPWDMYRGKRRCPTCGVPSLICRDCFEADRDGRRKLNKFIRCDLCVEENIRSKAEIKERERKEQEEYEAKLARSKGNRGVGGDNGTEEGRERMEVKKGAPLLNGSNGKNRSEMAPNPEKVTRLFLKNMCAKRMDEETLLSTLPGITHIQWITDRKTGKFYGSAFVEMSTPDDAARAVAMDGTKVLGRPLKVRYQKPDPKDLWPPPSCAV